jgi:hypothetical protein
MRCAYINEARAPRMSSLFSQMSGFQFPDVMMNSGPLPSTAGGPAGSDGSVDGVINGTSALLGNISPYALGKSARTGSDRNYQQIPHRFQYIIPRLWIPHFSSETFASASHAVDQGDIAFFMFGGSRAWWTCRDQYQTRAPQSAFGSIDMVNYILLCLQASKTARWGHIRKDLVEHAPFHAAMDRRARQAAPVEFDAFNVFRAVRLLVQQHFVPHGICAGSEHQGGQHEHQGGRPVQAPVNFIITMTVDGKNVDLVNYWYDKSMVAGDELIFRLEKQDCRATKEFHISRYYKDPVTVPAQIEPKAGWDYAYWQLVPAILDSTQTNQPEPAVPAWWCDHRSQGYWRIAQTFQTRKQNNINAFHRGMPLEVTFAPVWQSFAECEDLRGWSETYIQTCVTQHDNTQELAAEVTIGPDKTVTAWTYRGARVLTITDAYVEDDYRLEFEDKTQCKMLGATGRGAEFAEAHPPKLPKRTTDCWHVIFGADVGAVNQAYEPHIKETKKAQIITGTDARSFRHDIDHKAGADGVTHADFLVTFTKAARSQGGGRCKVTMTEQYLAKNKKVYNEFDNKFWGLDNESLPAEAPVTFGIVYHNKDRVAPLQVPDLQGGPPSPPQQPVDLAPPPPLNGAQVARLPAPALALAAAVPEFVAIKKKRAKAGDFLRDTGVSTDDCGRSAE